MIGLLVAGSASGVGKTTVALTIIAGLRRRGYEVQPFKGGPDFLDTTHHTRIAGRCARNLDTWMLTEAANRSLFASAAAGADAVVAEGMMGLFDGKDGRRESGSSAQIAKVLRLPVVLVLDCAKSVRSVAAVVLGFESFDPELPLAGVILNRVAGQKHYQMLEAAIRERCRTAVLGWLPHTAAIAIPERHLGLHAAADVSSPQDARKLEEEIDTLASLAEKHLRMEEIVRLLCPMEAAPVRPAAAVHGQGVLPRIGVARDKAFSFYYEDNLEMLRGMGAEVVPFSPLADRSLPANLDALYLGGGYPELYAQPLSENSGMVEQIRAFAQAGGCVYAECGGLVYLSRQLTTVDGAVYPLAGVMPLDMEMTGSLVDFGYVTVTFTRDCLLGPRGTSIRGHSFHYSRICSDAQISTSYEVEFSLSGRQVDEGFTSGRVLASYIHLHFGANPKVAQHLVGSLRATAVAS
jgi:cobyrinic acid a,c-diamide synthase